MDYLNAKNARGELPILFTSIGRWWGTNPKTKKQEEIDIIAEVDATTALFAECKWTNKMVDSHVLNNLIRKSQIFDYPIKHYYFLKAFLLKIVLNLRIEFQILSL